MSPLLSVAACAPTGALTVPDCAPLAVARVVDEVGAPGERDEAVAALGAFRTWTAETTVCVDEVRLVAEVSASDGSPAGGKYVQRDRTVYVKAGAGRVTQVVQHELCHALDRQLGLSDAHPELFPADDSGLDPAEPEVFRRHETFADDCGLGPYTADWSVRFGGCAVDGVVEPADPRWQLLRDEAFTGTWSERRALDFTPIPLDLGEALALSGPQAAADGTLWLEARHDGYYTYVRVDPVDGAVLGALDEPVDPLRLRVGWYGGVGDPAILTWGIGPHLAWRATPSGPTPSPYPELAMFDAGALIDDTLYVQAAAAGEACCGLYRVALATGTAEPEPEPPGDGALITLTATGAGLAGAWQVGGVFGDSDLAVRPTDGDWRVIPAPARTSAIDALASGPDTVFAQLVNDDASVLVAVAGPVGWTFATMPCAYAPAGWALVGDAPIAIDRDTNTLLRFTVGETP